MTQGRDKHHHEDGNGNGHTNSKPWLAAGIGGHLGPWLKLHGGQSMTILLRVMIFAAIGGLGVGGWFHHLEVVKDAKARTEEHDKLMTEIKLATKTQAEMVTAQQEMTYVLTLSADQREKLNLAMPDSLRRRLRGVNP